MAYVFVVEGKGAKGEGSMGLRSVLTVLAVAVVLCVGYATREARPTESSPAIPASSCLGHDGIQFSFNTCQNVNGTIAANSCNGDGACSFAGLNNGVFTVNVNSCIGAFACFGAA